MQNTISKLKFINKGISYEKVQILLTNKKNNKKSDYHFKTFTVSPNGGKKSIHLDAADHEHWNLKLKLDLVQTLVANHTRYDTNELAAYDSTAQVCIKCLSDNGIDGFGKHSSKSFHYNFYNLTKPDITSDNKSVAKFLAILQDCNLGTGSKPKWDGVDNFEYLEFKYENIFCKEDSYYCMVYSIKNDIYINIRGTSGNIQLFEEIAASLLPLRMFAGSDGERYDGYPYFVRVLNLISPFIQAQVHSILSNLNSSNSQNGPMSIYFCGHSLGAAVVQMLSLVIDCGNAENRIVYGFGSPYAMTEKATTAMYDKCEVFLVDNRNDPVTSIPPDKRLFNDGPVFTIFPEREDAYNRGILNGPRKNTIISFITPKAFEKHNVDEYIDELEEMNKNDFYSEK